MKVFTPVIQYVDNLYQSKGLWKTGQTFSRTSEERPPVTKHFGSNKTLIQLFIIYSFIHWENCPRL